jgi:hypothetical protein
MVSDNARNDAGYKFDQQPDAAADLADAKFVFSNHDARPGWYGTSCVDDDRIELPDSISECADDAPGTQR